MDISANKSVSCFHRSSELKNIGVNDEECVHSVDNEKVGNCVAFEEREQDGVPIKCRSIKKIAVNALIGVAVVGTVGSVIVASPVLAVYDVVKAYMADIVLHCSLLGVVAVSIAVVCLSAVVVPLAIFVPAIICVLAGVSVAIFTIFAAEAVDLLREMLCTAMVIFSPVLVPLLATADVPMAIVDYSIRASRYVMDKIMERFPELYPNQCERLSDSAL